MPALPPGLAPLLKLAAQLNDIADHIDDGVLSYHEANAVAYVRHELWAAAERLVYVLESTWTGDADAPGEA
jgi:hypothetical protein